MNKTVKIETKKLSAEEFLPIEATFDKPDFTKVYKESVNNFGCDGWSLKYTIGKIMSNLAVLVWFPSKHKNIPETTKLLKSCDKTYNIFPGEYRKC